MIDYFGISCTIMDPATTFIIGYVIGGGAGKQCVFFNITIQLKLHVSLVY